jgi:hypothetical protein
VVALNRPLRCTTRRVRRVVHSWQQVNVAGSTAETYRVSFVTTRNRAMPGYSGTPLAKKFGLKEGQRVALFSAPAGFRETLAPVPPRIHWQTNLRAPIDCVILFAPRAAALDTALRPAAAALTSAGMLWVAWPKKAAKVPTDLTEDRVRAYGLAAGLVDVKVCAVTDVWSGLKFVRRLKDR